MPLKVVDVEEFHRFLESAESGPNAEELYARREELFRSFHGFSQSKYDVYWTFQIAEWYFRASWLHLHGVMVLRMSRTRGVGW